MQAMRPHDPTTTNALPATARGPSRRALALVLAACACTPAVGAAQAATDPLALVCEAFERMHASAPHRPSDEELAPATEALGAIAPAERTAPAMLASVTRLANAVISLGRGDAALQWLQPIDEQLAASPEPLRRHALAAPLGDALLRAGRLPEAHERLAAAYAVLGEPPTATEPTTHAVRRQLALALFSNLDYASALPLQELVVATQRLATADGPALLADLRQLGRIHHRLGHRQAAYDTFEQCLGICKRTWPADHAEVLVALVDFASSTAQLGDYRAAYEMLREALAGRERTLPATDPLVLGLKQTLSQVLVQLGELAEARRLQMEVLDVLESSPTRDEQMYLTGMQYFARILHAQGDYDGSRETIVEVIAALVGRVPEHDRDLGTARYLLANLERRRGALPEARALGEAAFAGLSKSLPLDHNFTQIAAADLISTCRRQGDTARAVELATLLLKAATESLQTTVLAARPTARLVGIQHMGIEHALSLAFDDLDSGARRSLLVNTLLVSQLLKGAAGHVARHAGHVRSVRAAELSRIEAELAAAGNTSSPDQLVESVRTRERLERELLQLRKSSANEAPTLPMPTIDALTRALPAGSAAVATVPFMRRFLAPDAPSGMRAIPWLAGIVLQPGGEIQLVDLGSREAMLDQVDHMQASTHKQMRSLLFDPVRRAVPEASVLFLALDDGLQLVPWDALPLPSGALVGSAVELRRVSSLLDLVADKSPPAAAPRMVAVGGVDYGKRPAGDAPVAAVAPVAAGTTAPPLSLLRGGTGEFVPIQGSMQEAQTVETSFRGAFPGASVTLLTGNAATKDALAAAVSGATYVHLATHGFVAYDRIQATAGAGKLRSVAVDLSPFSLCGLALAGANLGHDRSGQCPGLMTAAELQHFDFGHCELAVLSACESALGAWSKGQGFASLHEALHIAGARYVVSTLWPVSDAAAQRLMAEFYRALWRAPDQPYRALWTAKQIVRDEGMSFGDWAAFQLSGT
jgi:tetratricopeptide (TPR) repeat protein